MKNVQLWERCSNPHVYLIQNNINGLIYIGQHSGRQKNYFASGKVIKEAIRMYGQMNFSRIILEQFTDIDQLDISESNYISLYDSSNPSIGYNKCPKGTGKIQVGDIPWNKGGGKYSAESLMKMRLGKLGKTLSDDIKSKMSAASLGKPKSDSHIMNMRIGQGKNVIQMDLEGNHIQEFEATSFAAESVGCARESIRDACKGKMKTCKGFKWKFKENI